MSCCLVDQGAGGELTVQSVQSTGIIQADARRQSDSVEEHASQLEPRFYTRRCREATGEHRGSGLRIGAVGRAAGYQDRRQWPVAH